jgi:UDP-N-acetylmuramate: L-alanyl-gamma-D-glutamyl-meso-diaminopimelate ligase
MHRGSRLATDMDSRRLEPPAHVHLMGICGTGMGSLAGMFHESGYRVTGSDQGAYPPMSDFLNKLGIPVMEGYSAGNLHPKPDLVVVGNVIRRDNAEAIELENSGISFCTMPDALNIFFADGRKQIVIAGTHGKTTVSSMIAWILYDQGLDPGFMIGGLPLNFMKNYRLGTGEYFVVEGDEYDTAYFEKTPKFVHYHPHVGVITSCEFDHGDIYDSLDEIKEGFREFAALIPSYGCLVAFGGDEGVRQVAAGNKLPVEYYGSDTEFPWHGKALGEDNRGIKVQIVHRHEIVASGTLPVVGYHNLMNATAAVAVAIKVGIEPQQAFNALESFKGIKRRQEILGEVSGILVIDDFAHHPTAVKETCSGVRARFADRRLVTVFEPRTNTSRRSIFQKDYISAFLQADVVVLREPRDVDKIPRSDRFSSERLAQDLRDKGREAHAFKDTDAVEAFLDNNLRKGDVVLIMSNGSFDDLNNRLMANLKA